MCNPVAIGLAALAVFQGYQQKRQADSQAKYQERVAEVNAVNQENEATKVRNKSVEEENAHRREVAQLLGRQRAQLGANGVVTTSGSALQLQEDTVQLGEDDALRIRRNYDDQATALEQGAENTRYQGEFAASQTRAKGDAAFTSSLIGAASGALPVASKWYTSNSAAKTASTASPHFGTFAPGSIGSL